MGTSSSKSPSASISPDTSISSDGSVSRSGRPRAAVPSEAAEPTRPVTIDPAGVGRPVGRQSARARDTARSAPDSHHTETVSRPRPPPTELPVLEAESLESYKSSVSSPTAEERAYSTEMIAGASCRTPPAVAGRRAARGKVGSIEGACSSGGGPSGGERRPPSSSRRVAPTAEGDVNQAFLPHPEWAISSGSSSRDGASADAPDRGGCAAAMGGGGPRGGGRKSAAVAAVTDRSGAEEGGSSSATAAMRMLEVVDAGALATTISWQRGELIGSGSFGH
eukprot:3555408-Prymnesium_polylepis.1